MREGKYLKLQAEKKARKNYRTGTIRLVAVGLSGIAGIFYLFLCITELVTGKVEIWPTIVHIDQIEAHGFPDASYLQVEDAYLVFPEASYKAKNRGTESNFLAVPAVSQSLMTTWQGSAQQREHIDATRYRLFVLFTGKQVDKLWPRIEQRIEPNKGWSLSPLKMTVSGETGPAKWSVFRRPMHSDLIKKNLDWKQVRYLKFERHTHSLGRSVKQFFYAAILLSLAMLVLRIHLKQRGRIPDGTPDPIIAQDFTPDDSSDFDIDIE